MPTIDDDSELDLLDAFEKGQLKSVATKGELAKFKAAARATRHQGSSGDLSDIQVKALEEGIPCQTLIASVLPKYVTGRLAERPVKATKPKAPVQPRSIK